MAEIVGTITNLSDFSSYSKTMEHDIFFRVVS